MEPRFGFDFSRVRIHRDREAEQAASGISARAFTLGRHIAFGPGEYAPGAAPGRELLAHELAHVVQYAQDQSPLIHRTPLKGRSGQQFDEKNDTADIDKAVAASPITNYVKKDSLKTLAGNVDTQLPTVFEAQYKDYGQSEDDVDQVAGFVNRKDKTPVKLRRPGKNSANKVMVAADVEAAVHETVHLNSAPTFQNNFGHNYNEGVTEHFTELVLGEQGRVYREQLKLAEGLISALGNDGEDLVGRAFFLGDGKVHDKVMDAFAKDYSSQKAWREASTKKPPDTEIANKLLAAALSQQSAGNKPPAAQTKPDKPQSK